MNTLKSPYPYFGGKSKVAEAIWQRFGDVPNFIDPFFGSGAVLLARPHEPDLELVNDLDGYVANFWRAVQADAEAVAAYADYPAFENDLHARHAWLVQRKDSLRERLEGDPDWYDAKVAGWWVWGMSLWIGSGFCSGKGRWQSVDGKLVQVDVDGAIGDQLPRPIPVGVGSAAVAEQLPKVVDRSLRSQEVEAWGVARQLPTLTVRQGVNGAGVVGQPQRIELSGEPKGVHRKLPESGKSARGVASRPNLEAQGGICAYFDALQARFRRVRVTCGDWSRVVTPAVLQAKSPCAVLLDPPYVQDSREAGVYSHDDAKLYAQVREWALANGDNPDLRIAYCGYDDGFEFPAGWECLRWKANGGYSNQGEERRENAKRECVWFSPYCVKPSAQMPLFAAALGAAGEGS